MNAIGLAALPPRNQGNLALGVLALICFAPGLDAQDQKPAAVGSAVPVGDE